MDPLHADMAQDWRLPEDYPDHFHEALRPIAGSLMRNVDRMASLLEVLPACTEASMNLQTRRDLACFNILGNLAALGQDHPKLPELEAEYQRLAAIPTDQERTLRPFVSGQRVIFELMSKNAKVKSGVEAILAAVVVMAWTTYETLTTDLWVACVDRLPDTLGVAVFKSPLLNANDPDAGTVEKSIDMSKLRQFDFNLRPHMGKVLRSRFNFNRLGGIKKAYDAAFKRYLQEDLEKQIAAHGSSAKVELDDRAHELSVLEALRNVIVHRGGIADEQFMSRVKNDRFLGHMKPGEVVQLDPDVVYGWCWTVIAETTRLISVGQGVLSKHQE